MWSLSLWRVDSALGVGGVRKTQHLPSSNGAQGCLLERIARKREHDSLASMNHPFVSGPLITQTDAGLVAKLPKTWARTCLESGYAKRKVRMTWEDDHMSPIWPSPEHHQSHTSYPLKWQRVGVGDSVVSSKVGKLTFPKKSPNRSHCDYDLNVYQRWNFNSAGKGGTT